MKNQAFIISFMMFVLGGCQPETSSLEPTNFQHQSLTEKTSALSETVVSSAVGKVIATNPEAFMAIIKEGFSETEIKNLTISLGIEIKTYIPRFRMIAFLATSSQLELLKASPMIQAVQVDVSIPMHLSTATTQVRSREVVSNGVDGDGARVCIIDSGIFYHNELPMPEAEYDFVFNDDRAEDENGHGTAVAGIIASQDPDVFLVKGNTGVAPRATLLIARVFGATGSASGSSIASALDWCANNNADVINMSLGHGGFTSSCDTDFTALFSNQVADKGIIVVAATGNDGYADKISSPACGSKVLAVGSVNKQDGHSYFSNSGSQVDIVAPGEAIVTTGHAGGFKSFSGTSAATPFIAGVAALLRSMPERPSVTMIKNAIMQTGKDYGTPGKDYQYGNGRVDAYRAYEYVIQNSGGLTGGTSGGTTGGSTGGLPGGATGGTTGGGSGDTTPTTFTFGMVTTSNEAKSNAYKSSHKKVTQDCPANHYLSDFSIQGATWFLSSSVTWMKLECQSFSTLNTSTVIGVKQGSKNVGGNLCGNKQAITALDVKTSRYIKDLKAECANVSYDSKAAGKVKLEGHSMSSFALGRGFFFDSTTPIDCPLNTVAVGVDASYRSDSDEWAFTRIRLRCAPISTSR